MSELRKTPLNEYYHEVGAKLVDFGGWEMPVSFTSIKEEHNSVREDVGIFDVSHMGEIRITGPEAEKFANYTLTNDASKLSLDKAQYTFLCNEKGGVEDDLVIYKLADNDFLLVPNAANTDHDFDLLNGVEGFDAKVENVSSEYGQIAIQGPNSRKLIQSLTDEDISEMGMFNFKQDVEVAGFNVLLSQSGYTGEDGFELYTKPEDVLPLWKKLKALGAVECGLGARDTLRMEAGLPLHGQELSPDITPLEAKLGFAVKVDKGDFIGQEVLKNQKENGVKRRSSKFEITGKGIARTGYEVLDNAGNKVGEVTSGTQSPSSKKSFGFALVDTDFYELDKEFIIKIRNREVSAKFIRNFK
ncbi:glycine cleavage system aminomethyltransferase GcvT [Phocicoccus pinnipedialis]|uniref:Aminomethyltransferase n=2 Tax=Phocicoccus pinnipedialis TaxID=110845 RepID=A0A6V7RFJ1_9BACL|nr:glycine cleavage system aminomethyltransferase GcvT [Jeotgalicoccus pinnipedialis]MBP1939308.1 aminomethyltransferase [Jeotgalicoccus pinnipedialis]CAD2075941.1 Aminomethyltransferase [Jeotgalicoccus pinnipedialis]